MFISRLQLLNFKRFTDLTIDLRSLSSAPKLILLIGSNGSGKTSVFDAFNSFQKRPLEIKETIDQELEIEIFFPFLKDSDNAYYRKDINKETSISISFPREDSQISIPSKDQILKDQLFLDVLPPNRFYGRSSMRQIPRLTRKQLGEGSASIESDSDRPLQYIDRDLRMENDIEHVTKLILKEFFVSDKPRHTIIDEYIQPINNAFRNIFGDNPKTSLSIQSFIPPLEGEVAEILFQKGESEISYDLLSSGEKEVFNILINLLSRRYLYQDTIYFIDELDLHLNTALQYNLLKEITENWIPDNCQLWTASHSLGFIDYANEAEHAAIIDFDNLDFDIPQDLLPKEKNRLEVYEIAIPQKMLFKIFEGKNVVLCENQNDEYYNLLGIPNTVFLGVMDSNEVFHKTKANAGYIGLRDRDLVVDEEINKLEQVYPNYKILRYYNFENYLYHPLNIAELKPTGFVLDSYIDEIVRQKNQKFESILVSVNSSRLGYAELKEKGTKHKESDVQIINSLKSNELEQFYKFFDMKTRFDKSVIAKFNLSKEQLVQTNWFKTQISQILGI